MKRASLIVFVAMAVGLLPAATASATTFCVPNFHPACPNAGGNVAEASIETAMQTNAGDGIADTILVDGVTVTNPDPITATGSDPLTIQGAGPAATTVTTSDPGNEFVLNLFFDLRAVTIRDLEIAVPATAPDNGGAAAQVSGDSFVNVDIVSKNPGTTGSSGSQGITTFGAGGSFRDGEFRVENGGALNTAIMTGNFATGPVTVADTVIRDAVNAIGATDTDIAVTARGISVFDPGQSVFSASSGGTLIVENATVRGETVFPLAATANTANNSTLIADHVTAENTGSSNLAALNASANSSSGNANLFVSNSIFTGFDFGWLRQVAPASSGAANLAVEYSNLTQNGSSNPAHAGALAAANNITADPLFVEDDDFHLTAASPSIDAGDPAPGGLATDLDGLLRPQDGNDDGSAIRDQGAFEFPDPTPPVDPPDPPTADTQPPETKIDSGPGRRKLLRKRRAQFTFSSSEAGSSFDCKLDTGSFAPCASPVKLKKLKRGKHSFAVRATDAAGNTDASPAVKTFKVKKKKRKR